MVKTISIIVKGKPNYERWTIYQWILSFKDLLEEKHCIKLDVAIVDSDNDYPVIIIDNMVIEEPPFEEGYVLEVLDQYLGRILESRKCE